MDKCKDCKGTGKITLLIGSVDCEKCGGTGTIGCNVPRSEDVHPTVDTPATITLVGANGCKVSIPSGNIKTKYYTGTTPPTVSETTIDPARGIVHKLVKYTYENGILKSIEDAGEAVIPTAKV